MNFEASAEFEINDGHRRHPRGFSNGGRFELPCSREVLLLEALGEGLIGHFVNEVKYFLRVLWTSSPGDWLWEMAVNLRLADKVGCPEELLERIVGKLPSLSPDEDS